MLGFASGCRESDAVVAGVEVSQQSCEISVVGSHLVLLPFAINSGQRWNACSGGPGAWRTWRAVVKQSEQKTGEHEIALYENMMCNSVRVVH